MKKENMIRIASAVIVLALVFPGCAAKKSSKFVKQSMPKGSAVGIIVDSQNDVKNAIMVKFMEKGFKVKAINASDLYTLNDSFTIKDLYIKLL